MLSPTNSQLSAPNTPSHFMKTQREIFVVAFYAVHVVKKVTTFFYSVQFVQIGRILEEIKTRKTCGFYLEIRRRYMTAFDLYTNECLVSDDLLHA